jgi:hypothetical protein
MARRQKFCKTYGCPNPPAIGGICTQHYEEDRIRQMRREAAVELLHRGLIDGQPVTTERLRDELRGTQDWWSQVCSVVNAEREHPVLKDETQYAVDWCIGLAASILDEERELRAGKRVDAATYEYLRRGLWDRFQNLERGLMSNGVSRPERRRKKLGS